MFQAVNLGFERGNLLLEAVDFSSQLALNGFLTVHLCAVLVKELLFVASVHFFRTRHLLVELLVQLLNELLMLRLELFNLVFVLVSETLECVRLVPRGIFLHLSDALGCGLIKVIDLVLVLSLKVAQLLAVLGTHRRHLFLKRLQLFPLLTHQTLDLLRVGRLHLGDLRFQLGDLLSKLILNELLVTSRLSPQLF